MPEQNKNSHILLVDDDSAILKVLGAMLTHLGYDFALAHDGDDALKTLDHVDGFFLVITDINMPGMDGWQLAQRLNEVKPELPVIALTGEHPDNVLPKLASSNIDFALFKPVGINTLNKTIEKYQSLGIGDEEIHSSDCR